MTSSQAHASNRRPSRPSGAPRWLVWLAVSSVMLLSACSILQLLYKQAPNYFMWRSNLAFNFDAEQREATRASLRSWFDWQRHQQLPLMARFLKRSQTEVLGEITPALACERRDETEQWARAGIERAAPLVAQLAVTLKPAQIKHLAEFFDSRNEDFTDDFLPLDPAERQEAATDFVLKWAGLVYGRMNDAQRQQLSADLARLPFDAAVILQQFKRFQGAFLALMREVQSQHLTTAQTQARVQALLLDSIDPADPARKAEMQRWITAGCQAASAFHNRTTPAQRKEAAEQFKTWEVDFTELAKP